MRTTQKQKNSGGYHQAWLIPAEGAFAFVMLNVGLMFGGGAVAGILGMLFVGVVIFMAKTEPAPAVSPYNLDAWREAMDAWTEEAISSAHADKAFDRPIPQLENFKIEATATAPEQPVVKIEKDTVKTSSARRSNSTFRFAPAA